MWYKHCCSAMLTLCQSTLAVFADVSWRIRTVCNSVTVSTGRLVKDIAAWAYGAACSIVSWPGRLYASGKEQFFRARHQMHYLSMRTCNALVLARQTCCDLLKAFIIQPLYTMHQKLKSWSAGLKQLPGAALQWSLNKLRQCTIRAFLALPVCVLKTCVGAFLLARECWYGTKNLPTKQGPKVIAVTYLQVKSAAGLHYNQYSTDVNLQRLLEHEFIALSSLAAIFCICNRCPIRTMAAAMQALLRPRLTSPHSLLVVRLQIQSVPRGFFTAY